MTESPARGAPYAPYMDDRTAEPPGLSPLDPAAWLTADPDFASQMQERDALIESGAPDVAAQTDDAGPIVAEFRAALFEHLAARPEWTLSDGAARRPDGIPVSLSGETMALAGRLAQEDFLLLAPGEGAAEARLVAGVLCFPSRWSLTEKLGRALSPIHAPTPRYAGDLAARVNRVFAALRPERPLMRVNWLVTPTDRLRLVQREDAKAPHAPPGAQFWLRTERQTLLRLPHTGAVVFGVKTTLTPVGALTAEERAVIARRMAGWPAADVDYRGGAAQHAAALAALA
ncbi:heme-dependent oxidative N-demethylase family protein [Rubrimonas cliftonensis]|uniref:DUF3445 domain-containing protein n=1 Tax=Rubrimonas cliftonensis TaxID=89524 RepID=A0A1H4AEX9_9RHOB|nr:DUF3445 domain-containing protein [Rubrimonas cliftonensis]SEA34291.1 Protein of unknown function [Rubrimonas cliftonensis]